MELKRSLGVRMSFALFIVRNLAMAIALSGVDNLIDRNLDCTNDLDEWLSCDFKAQNCTEYHLTLLRNKKEVNCTFSQCGSGQCCCSTQMLLIYGETHNATVWRGSEKMGYKIIDIKKGVKPKVPTITSVKETNGNFQVKWKTNMEGSYLSDDLSAGVTYKKQGSTKEESVFVTPTKVYGFNCYDILGRLLEPSTTYVVSVRSFTNMSGRFSDSSNEVEFTTPASRHTLILATILSLSIAAVIISGVLYGCYVKLKSKWWDSVAKCPNPKLLDMHPSQREVLKPVLPVISRVCVEPLVANDSKPWWKGSLKDTSSGSPQQSSGISTGSSTLSYASTEPADIIAGVQEALGKAFASISPKSTLPTNPCTESNKDSGLFSAPCNPCRDRADDTSFGSSDFDNRTYSILIPSSLHQVTTRNSEGQTQAEMLCDSAYHPSKGDTVICADQQVPACPLFSLPPVVSSLVPTDMSYQQCNADSGGFSYAEDSSLSSILGGTNTLASCDAVVRVKAGCESSDAVVSGAMVITSDENPCYGCVPADSRSFPPVDNDYQAFQSLVEQPDVLFSEKRSGDEREHLSIYPEESFTKMPQSFFSPVVPGFNNSVQGGQCLSELQTPFVSWISANQPMPIITDSGYQSV